MSLRGRGFNLLLGEHVACDIKNNIWLLNMLFKVLLRTLRQFLPNDGNSSKSREPFSRRSENANMPILSKGHDQDERLLQARQRVPQRSGKTNNHI